VGSRLIQNKCLAKFNQQIVACLVTKPEVYEKLNEGAQFVENQDVMLPVHLLFLLIQGLFIYILPCHSLSYDPFQLFETLLEKVLRIATIL
jgi:hypothetical protein